MSYNCSKQLQECSRLSKNEEIKQLGVFLADNLKFMDIVMGVISMKTTPDQHKDTLLPRCINFNINTSDVEFWNGDVNEFYCETPVTLLITHETLW